jgi:hypothetical protein
VPSYDIVATVVSKPRPTGATNSVETPPPAQSTAGLQAKATAQFATYADENGVTRVRIGLLASGRYGVALYNAAGALVDETYSVPA